MDMKKLLSVVNTAEIEQKINADVKPTEITSPVLNVSEDAKPSMFGKYFKTVLEEFDELEQNKMKEVDDLAERARYRMYHGHGTSGGMNRHLKQSHGLRNKTRGTAKSGAKHYQKFINKESVDSVDTINLDVPLMIRLLEYAREDASSDMDLHRVAEKMIELGKSGTLTMDDYDQIVGVQKIQEEGEDGKPKNRAERRAAQFGQRDDADKKPQEKTSEISYKTWTIRWDALDRPANQFRAIAIGPKTNIEPLRVMDGISAVDALNKAKAMVDNYIIRNTKITSTSVMVDFNTYLSSEILDRQPIVYGSIFKLDQDSAPYLFLSFQPQEKLHRAVDRRSSVIKQQNPDLVLHAFSLSNSEAKYAGLLHGRYTLGPKIETDDKSVMYFPLEYHSPILPGVKVRVNEPAVTIVAPGTNVDES